MIPRTRRAYPWPAHRRSAVGRRPGPAVGGTAVTGDVSDRHRTVTVRPFGILSAAMNHVGEASVDGRAATLPRVAEAWRDVVVVVRVYNEGPVVGAVISELVEAGLPVIAVDDASTDDSAA